ncbi:Alpha/Beta hydrolase protein [Trichoderma evansii]
MGRLDRLRSFRRASNPPQPQENEARANLGIRPFPPREDIPPPEISGANVRRIDIIAVHGLGGNWLKTWRADDGAIWLRDRLPQLLAEKNIQSRVLSFGYDADVIFTKTINDIEMVAGDLLNQIDSIRTTPEQKETPIIFVAHSLGGLVVKAAFNKAWTENKYYQNIVDRAAGCVFLGVPNRGADLARWARNAATIMSLSGFGNKRLVQAISRSSDEWKKVGWDFVFRTANILIVTIFETELTGGMMVVDQNSARLGILGERSGGLPRSNHRTICKFGDSQDESDRFLVLGNFVTWIAESALERG